MNNNIFTTLLRYINVPFTEKYASEAYFFQPYRNTMYGLMQLLNKYKINNECIEFADKADVFQSTMPCIIVYDDKFYILKGFIGDKVIIISRTGKETNIKCSDFLAAWNGIALTLHPNRQSTEPNIKAHHKSEIIAYC